MDDWFLAIVKSQSEYLNHFPSTWSFSKLKPFFGKHCFSLSYLSPYEFNFCGKFKPHVSDSFTLNPWEGCVTTAIACPKKSQSLSKSFIRAKRWGGGNGGKSLERPQRNWGSGSCFWTWRQICTASSCGQFLFYTPLMGVGLENGTGLRAEKKQDVCRSGSLAQTHISTNHTLTILSLFLYKLNLYPFVRFLWFDPQQRPYPYFLLATS